MDWPNTGFDSTLVSTPFILLYAFFSWTMVRWQSDSQKWGFYKQKAEHMKWDRGMLFQKRNCSYNPQERAALQQDSSKMLSFQLFPVFFCSICHSSFWLSTIKTNMEVICSQKNLRMVGFSLQSLRTQGLPVHFKQRRSSNVLHVSKKKKITLFWITHILGFPLYQSVTTLIGDCIDSLQWEVRQVPNKLNKHPAWFQRMMTTYSIRFTPLESFTSKILITLSKSKLCFTIPIAVNHEGSREKNTPTIIMKRTSFQHYHSSEVCCAALYLFSNRFWDANTLRKWWD